MKTTDKAELFIATLQDLVSAESQIIDSIPKMTEAIKSSELKGMLNDHLGETENQKERLTSILEAVDSEEGSETCEAMKGLLAEGSELIKNHKPGVQLDIALAGAAAKVEHYEMSAYSSAIALALALGHEDHAQVLRETFSEEISAAMKLESFFRQKLKVEDDPIFSENHGLYAEMAEGGQPSEKDNPSRKRKTANEFMSEKESDDKETKEMAKTRENETRTRSQDRSNHDRYGTQEEGRYQRTGNRNEDYDYERGQRYREGAQMMDDDDYRGQQQWNDSRDEDRGFNRSRTSRGDYSRADNASGEEYGGGYGQNYGRGSEGNYGRSQGSGPAQGDYSQSQNRGNQGRYQDSGRGYDQDREEYERSYSRNRQYRDEQGRYMTDDDYRSGRGQGRWDEGNYGEQQSGRQPWDDNDRRGYSTSPYSNEDRDRRWSENPGHQEYRGGRRGNWNDEERMYGQNYPSSRGNQSDYDRPSRGQRHERNWGDRDEGNWNPGEQYRDQTWPPAGEGRYASEDYEMTGRYRGTGSQDYDEDMRGDNPNRGRRGAYRK